MALTREEIDQVMKTLRDTSMRPEGGVKYPEEIRAFENWARQEIITLEAEGMPFTVYQCIPEEMDGDAPLFVNIHGGGWYIGHEENDLYFSCWLAKKIRGVVLSVDYTTSDIKPWEVMFGQCYEALKYAFEKAESLGCSREKISVGGYSAGGHLTAGLAMKAAEEGYGLKSQIICYAPLDMREKEQVPAADPAEERMQVRMRCFSDLLFRRENTYLENSLANPWIMEDGRMKNLPPALIITAGKCGFRFENEAYGFRMAGQGVPVTIKRFLEARHGFIPHFAEYWQEAAELIVENLTQD